MSRNDHEPLLANGKEQKDGKNNKRMQQVRDSLSEQTPSVLLLLALMFGIVAGVVAYIYSKYDLLSRTMASAEPRIECGAWATRCMS